MKTIMQLTCNVACFAVLPVAVICFVVTTLPLCLSKGANATDLMQTFAIACIPSWVYFLIGLLALRKDLIGVSVFRKR